MKRILLSTLALFLWSLSVHAQIITTVAGSDSLNYADGVPATDIRLLDPSGVAVDNAGNFYIAERGANKIRKVDASGIIPRLSVVCPLVEVSLRLNNRKCSPVVRSMCNFL